jgi:anti-sigma regulatory factor (Ser/Thr protein kinase)
LALTAGTIAVPATDSSLIGEARRAATRLAVELGFSESDAGTVALVVTEVATNLVRHAVDGQLLLRPMTSGTSFGLEVLAFDRGPGIPNVARALEDGYSTAGTAGKGLGAVKRLSSLFDIFSEPGVGTLLVSQIWPIPRGREGLLKGVVSLPKPGEIACGDAWVALEQPGRALLAVVDGLGHGAPAAEASRLAVDVINDRAAESVTEIVGACHLALRATRGAALGVAELRYADRTVHFCGVGNISGFVRADKARGFASQNGIIGHQTRTLTEFTYPWPGGALVALYSDGLSTRTNLEAVPALTERHPSLVAAALFRDFSRGRDDATVLCAREVSRS